MAYLDYVSYEEATGRAKELLGRFRERESAAEQTPRFMQMLANNPEMLEARIEYFQRRFYGGVVDRKFKEMIYVAISRDNRCEYCASAHGGVLIKSCDVPEDIVNDIVEGEYGSLSERERTVIEFSEKMNRNSNRITQEDVDSLANVGFDEAGIVELVLVTASAMAANAYVNALNITHTPTSPPPANYTAGVE